MTEETTQALAPAPAAIDEAAPATAPETVTSPPDDAGIEPERKHWSQRRIDELTRNWRESERREQALLEMLRDRQQPTPEPPKPAEPARMPTLADFEYDEGRYQTAFLDYATKQAEAVIERRFNEREQRAVEQQRQSTHEERMTAYAKARPDFADRASDPTLPISQPMAAVIMDSDSGPEIVDWLADNREAAAKIARLPPHLAALELGRVEGRLEAEKAAKAAAAAPPPVPSVTQAPPPPPVVEDSDTTLPSVKASSPDSDALPDAEWMRLREKELRRQQKR